jgi:hypothetical protein
MTSFISRATQATALAVALGALSAAATAQGPAKRPLPPSAVVPVDSAPALITRKAPSAPPSSVAPRIRAPQAIRAAQPDSGVRPMTAVSAPVESVRPAAVQAPIVEPLPARTSPARPAATMRAEPVAAAASVSETPPANATGRCKDGTWVTSATVEASSCTNNGGLAARFPQKPVLPKRP